MGATREGLEKMRSDRAVVWVVTLLIALAALPAVAVGSDSVSITYTFTGGKRQTDDTVLELFDEAYKGRIQVDVQSTNLDGLKVNVVGGNSPDVALIDRFRTASVAAAGFLRPLDDLIARDGINPDDFFPPAWDECVFDGKVYCIPRSTDTRVMWYNKTMLEEFGFNGEEPPRTWEQTLDYSRKLTTWQEGELATIGLSPVSGNWYFQGWLWASGGDLLDPTNRTVTWHGPEGIKTMAWMQDMVDLYGGMANLNGFTANYGSHPMRVGRQAFEIGVFNYWDLRLKEVTEYEWGVANPPRPEGLEDTPISWSGGYGLAIPMGAENVDEAWELIKFYMTPEAQMAVSGTDIPVVAAVATSPEMLESTPFMRQIVGIMPYSKFRPAVPVSSEIYTIYRTHILNRFKDGEPPENILIDTAAQAQRILDEGWATYDQRKAQSQ